MASLANISLYPQPLSANWRELGAYKLKVLARNVKATLSKEANPGVALDFKDRRRGSAMSNVPSRVSTKDVRELKSQPMRITVGRKYQQVSVKDYLDRAPDFLKPDGGPPRWFCPVECDSPPKDAPVLFYLPGIDGIGQGLLMHHQTLADLFEVRCLHVPTTDRTSFEGLLEYIENSIKFEYAISNEKPIYIVGESFGGCLALAIAARNPRIDLILILCNPATSFSKSQLQPMLPLLEAMPLEFHGTLPYLLSFIMGDPIRMAMANVREDLDPIQSTQELSDSLTSLLPRLSVLADVIPKDTLRWKLKLLNTASLYANSRLHAIRATVLLLASGKDQLLPSREEGERLLRALSNCKLRIFNDSGHTLLLEDGLNLASLIKSCIYYRRSKVYDYPFDYVPPTLPEFKSCRQQFKLYLNAISPSMFSTLADGTIVQGLNGIPDSGPVLLVGYHMLMGSELPAFILEFLRLKNILVRGIAHPLVFDEKMEGLSRQPNTMDTVRLFGAVPVSVRNLFKLLASGSHVLLYPGGAREAFHRKGEQYKLFWPENSEFVRMAAKFGATIIPFGVIGEDDVAELVLDYNDLQMIPYAREWIAQFNREIKNLRQNTSGEVSNQDVHFPLALPKVPGRFYFLFGKPISTAGMETILQDRKEAHSLYLHVKSEVEAALAYLVKKREEDPYRNIVPRLLYEATWGFKREPPSFQP